MTTEHTEPDDGTELPAASSAPSMKRREALRRIAFAALAGSLGAQLIPGCDNPFEPEKYNSYASYSSYTSYSNYSSYTSYGNYSSYGSYGSYSSYSNYYHAYNNYYNYYYNYYIVSW